MSVRYLPHASEDIRRMLEVIGVDSVEALFQPIPEAVRLKTDLDLPPAMSEMEVLETFRRWASMNRVPPEVVSFLGAGAYRHYVPAVVEDVLRKPEFFTAYTPYQPEVSQGTLQSIFEFQTMVCQLTGMEVANASMYDGATALAEAVLMARRIREGRHVLVARSVHPEYQQVVNTYLRHFGVSIEPVPWEPETGQLDLNALQTRLRDDTFAVVVQSPNALGVIEDWAAVRAALGDHPAVRVACFTEALSLGILKPPGEFGFDIVVGEGQSLGLPVQFGGPHVGLMATRMEYVRRMPGRLVGVAYDRNGRRGFVLTLAAREQHIRREKATSNICTNQALCALAVTVYLALLGPEGLRQLALLNAQRAHYLARCLEAEGWVRPFRGPFFNEFVVRHPKAPTIWEHLLTQGIVAGLPLHRWYPELDRDLLMCVTEMNPPDQIERLVQMAKAP
ncbi:putative glycine dehydrogenase (decarboxylating) subunit 1 [bacterium HR11]|nr:putative glycine dehydrogenase (decarboxylating) subunit 1 [bacterium HR11]